MATPPYDTNALIKQSNDLLSRVKTEGVTQNGVQIYPPQSTTPSISTASLTPQTPLNFQTTPQTPVPVVSDSLQQQIDAINKQYNTPLPQEQEISSLQRSIMDLTGQTSQENARRAQLEADPALQAKRQTVQDLTAQANALIAESKAIPIRIQQDIQQGGANVTKGGIAPIQTAQLRNNAIQSLSVGSLLSAAQGNLTLALDKVDRAISAEFQPKKDELAAKRANLEMLLSDPSITREEKRRAEIARATIQSQEEETQRAETERQVIMDTGIKAASLGADALTLKAIQSAQTAQEAQQILMNSGLLTPAPGKAETQVVKLDNGNTVLLDTQTGKIIRELGGAKPTESKVGGSVITTTDGQTVAVSNEAQQWVDAINSGAMSLDDALTKIGSTAASRELKSQIIAGVNAQGGQTATKLEQMKNTVSTIDDILNGDFEYFGASIAPREGWMSKIIGGNPYYEAFKSKVDNLVASLTVDNLALLKGPMSDKDIEFVKQLSSGINMKMSESAARDRLEKIKTRLNEKINNASSTVLKSPDGTQQVNVSDLTPTELQEARDAGWK